MFTLSGEVFSVNKTSQDEGEHLRAVLSSEQSQSLCRYHRVASTSQLLSTQCVTLSFLWAHLYQIAPGRFNDSFVCNITDVSFCFLCSKGRRLSNFDPANMSRVHNCLNTSCGTEGTPGWYEQEHREVKGPSDQCVGVGRVFRYVDIKRCFLVMLLCVSSVRTFFLN